MISAVTIADSANAITQLEVWRASGLYPELHTTPDGWSLVIRTSNWHAFQDDATYREKAQRLSYATGWHPTIVAAVQAAQEVIK
jgi:hypothetical protein